MKTRRERRCCNHGYFSYVSNLFSIIAGRKFRGWGRKRTGRFALWCYEHFGGELILFEDGFIRSLGLGVEGAPSFSLVEDDVGIYYDAKTPSKLENILNTYDFFRDDILMKQARKAIALVKDHHISKYNNAQDINNRFRSKYGMRDGVTVKRILVIAQTAGDASLEYGMLDACSTDELIASALRENPDDQVYLKVHPDVLSGKKHSDIDIEKAKEKCIIIEESVDPMALLEYFSKVYTKTSGMGFEALLVGCECVCFGMPFYAGWGVTDDRSRCERRIVTRSVEEIFAAAYILYTRYNNPYKERDCDIFEVIEEIVARRL